MARSFEEELITGFASDQDDDKQLEVMIGRARDAGFGAALGAFDLLNRLPAALVRARERELERLRAVEGEAHPRFAALTDQIDGMKAMARTAALGKARMERAIAAQFSRDWLLHGFVSDRDANPLSGWTVVLSSPLLDAPMHAETAEDGYFRMTLARRDADALDRIAEDAKEPDRGVGRVEVFAPGGRTAAYSDPLPVAVGSGRLAVRDYIIEASTARNR